MNPSLKIMLKQATFLTTWPSVCGDFEHKVSHYNNLVCGDFEHKVSHYNNLVCGDFEHKVSHYNNLVCGDFEHKVSHYNNLVQLSLTASKGKQGAKGNTNGRILKVYSF
jgi:hypothetical protein